LTLQVLCFLYINFSYSEVDLYVYLINQSRRGHDLFHCKFECIIANVLPAHLSHNAPDAPSYNFIKRCVAFVLRIAGG